MDGLAGRALAALDVPRRARSVRGPKALALPTSLGIIDAAIQALRKEAHGVGNPHHEPVASLRIERLERIVVVCSGDRNVVAHSERVVLVDPVVVVRVGAAHVRDAIETRPWRAIERPALGALLAGCSRA